VANAPVSLFDILGLLFETVEKGPDFLNFYWVYPYKAGTVNENLSRYQFKGATGQLDQNEHAPEIVAVPGKPNCFCVKEGTGLLKIMVTWYAARAGRPTFDDLPKNIRDYVTEHRIRLKITPAEFQAGQDLADYATWHEKTEVDLYRKLHDHTIAEAERRCREYRCGKSGLRDISREALQSYIRWDKAKTEFDVNQKRLQTEFDRRFGPRGTEPVVIGEPNENFRDYDFYEWYNPAIWRD
jgi:hypothetical protein